MAIIKMNYGVMEAMAGAFANSREQVEDGMSAINRVLSMLGEGALIGEGGTAFAEALRDTLLPTLRRLTEKLEEMEQDVRYSLEAMQSADDQTARMY